MFVTEYLRLLGLMNLLSNDHVNDAAEEEKNITSHHKYRIIFQETHHPEARLRYNDCMLYHEKSELV